MKVKHNTKTAHYCNEQLSPTKDFGGAHKVALWPLNLGPLAVVCGSCADRWWCSGHQSCTHRHTRLSQHLSALDSTSSEPRLARLAHERKVSWF